MKESSQTNKVINKPVTDQVYEKIISYLKDGTWKVGDKLPSEAELADHFGVNKLTIRLAIQRLNTLGVLETKNGIGTSVIKFDFNNYINEVSDFMMSEDLLEDISDYRRAIEISSLELVIDRAKDYEFDELKEILDKYLDLESNITVESPKDDFIELINYDISFHKKIVKMSHNKLFLYGFNVCENVIYEHMLNLMKDRVKSTENEFKTKRFHDEFENLHTKIYETLRYRDLEECKKHYSKMLDT